MKLLCFLTAAAATAAIFAAPSGAHIPRSDCTNRLPPRAELACARENLHHARVLVAWATTEKRTVRLLVASPERGAKLERLIRAHSWLEETMRLRIAEAKRRMVYALPVVNDWLTAVRVVQRAYPGSEPWLVSCSRGEGGHGKWVPQAQGGTPGGWLQYKPGTFEHDFNRASADVRGRGFAVPREAHSWYSALGQALAGGWAWAHDRPTGKWTGAGC